MLSKFIKTKNNPDTTDIKKVIKETNDVFRICIGSTLINIKPLFNTETEIDDQGQLTPYGIMSLLIKELTNIKVRFPEEYEKYCFQKDLLSKLEYIQRNLKNNDIDTVYTLSDYLDKYFLVPFEIKNEAEVTFSEYKTNDKQSMFLHMHSEICKKVLYLNYIFRTDALAMIWIGKVLMGLNKPNDFSFNSLEFAGGYQYINITDIKSFGLIGLGEEIYSDLYKTLTELEKQHPSILSSEDYKSIKRMLKINYKTTPYCEKVINLEKSRLEYKQKPDEVDVVEEKEIPLDEFIKNLPQYNEANYDRSNGPAGSDKKWEEAKHVKINHDRDIEGFDLIVVHPQVDKSKDPYLVYFDNKIRLNDNYIYTGLPEIFSRYLNYQDYLNNQVKQDFEFNYVLPKVEGNNKDEIYNLSVNLYSKCYDFFLSNKQSKETYKEYISEYIKTTKLSGMDFMYERIQFVAQFFTLVKYNTILFSNVRPTIDKLISIEKSPTLLGVKEILDFFKVIESRCPEINSLSFYAVVKEFYSQLFDECKYLATATNLKYTQMVVYETLVQNGKIKPTLNYYHFAGFIVRGFPVKKGHDDYIIFLDKHSESRNEIQVEIACALYASTYDYMLRHK